MERVNQLPNSDVQTLDYALDFLAAQRAFIIADNFFRMTALIGLRAVDFLETAVAFLRPGFPPALPSVLVGQPSELST